MDYIFVIGPSAVGKTTLAKELYKHYGGVYIEQNTVPEFVIPEGVPDPGLYEEELCWENVLMQLRFFRDKGCENIVCLDFDDYRARELPLRFRGYDYIILRLVSSDTGQLLRQMEHRRDNEGGLYDPGLAEKSSRVIRERDLMPNEAVIDVAGKSREEVFAEALRIIDGFEPLKEYDYEPPDESSFCSWVFSRGLR